MIEKNKMNNVISMALVIGLMMLMAMGCSLDQFTKKDEPAANKPTSDSGNLEKTKNIEIAKPAETPAPAAPKKEQNVPPPTGATVGFSNGAGVVLRAEPNQTGRKVGSLARSQRLYIIKYSDDTETIKGVEGFWVYVQTENGSRGWVFDQYVSSQ